MAPGERFELSFPCENALYGESFPGARPTRLGDPGTVLRLNNSVKFDNIICCVKKNSIKSHLKMFIAIDFLMVCPSSSNPLEVILYVPSKIESPSFFI